ncbi:MAG: flagellar hook-basal body complex protein FliE [Nitrospira sp.]|nr:flagellar hook-basal body complex protein FliE [Nitrospira sp.]
MSQIHGIGSAVPAIPDIGSAGSAVSQPGSGGFMDSLKSAIGKVNDAQLQGGQAVDALLTGQTQDIHRTMVALQQASVSFQLMMQVRNKLVTAYEEIQRMQI